MDYVYFVQADIGGPVKIGTTRDLPRRLNDFQAGSPARLRVRYVMLGAHPDEHALKKRFATARSHNEWFLGHDEDLRRFVESLGGRVAPLGKLERSQKFAMSQSVAALAFDDWLSKKYSPRRHPNLLHSLAATTWIVDAWLAGRFLPCQRARVEIQRVAGIHDLLWAKYPGDTWDIPSAIRAAA